MKKLLLLLSLSVFACNDSSSESSAPKNTTTAQTSEAKKDKKIEENKPATQVKTLVPTLVMEETGETPTWEDPKAESVEVIIQTSMGDITVLLDAKEAPITVANFLGYVDNGFYDGTVFHRVIKTFMIQGGGFAAVESSGTYGFQKKRTKAGIKLEAAKDTALSNTRGTIAMARTAVLDSASAQFFINVEDNSRNLDANGGGYAVFGKVTSGLEVADKIKGVATTRLPVGMGDVPVEKVEIISVKRK